MSFILLLLNLHYLIFFNVVCIDKHISILIGSVIILIISKSFFYNSKLYLFIEIKIIFEKKMKSKHLQR
jgi:hypothetical protein